LILIDISEMFPRFPLNILITDLQTTHSIEHTIDNILEGRLVVPRILSEQEGPSGQQYPSANDYYLAADDITPTITSSSNSMSSSSSTSSATTISDQYEIEQHGSSLLFGNNADLLRDDSPDMLRANRSFLNTPFSDTSSDTVRNEILVEPTNVFSSNSSEREVMLQKRKEQMLLSARKK
jgi:E3 ubiquitin-protein ligase AMFR